MKNIILIALLIGLVACEKEIISQNWQFEPDGEWITNPAHVNSTMRVNEDGDLLEVTVESSRLTPMIANNQNVIITNTGRLNEDTSYYSSINPELTGERRSVTGYATPDAFAYTSSHKGNDSWSIYTELKNGRLEMSVNDSGTVLDCWVDDGMGECDYYGGGYFIGNNFNLDDLGLITEDGRDYPVLIQNAFLEYMGIL